ncbi:hypothetical protein CCUS01_03938 [Colletotrichum cuscutae]|uniref:Uncharacterized protein n=1 Tax=Colletotrichum cuscutae TaxID=1209917 RepID=A0AAI9VGY1_9PEZI|nr:hypothetical protein CCUS01_03938 [Colletotrichum cuscutae]
MMELFHSYRIRHGSSRFKNTSFPTENRYPLRVCIGVLLHIQWIGQQADLLQLHPKLQPRIFLGSPLLSLNPVIVTSIS